MERVSVIQNPSFACLEIAKNIFLVILLACCTSLTILAQAQLTTSDDEKTVTVNDAPDMEVYAIGKSVIVKGRAKGVLSFGGDPLPQVLARGHKVKACAFSRRENQETALLAATFQS